MALKNILGHSKQISQLRGSIQSGRVPHAYLFSGIEGVGKRLVALNIAKVLNCQNPVNPTSDLDSCDECVSCKKIVNKTHPDVKLIEPDGNSIKVDQLREILKSVSFKPYEGRWKVVIFNKAETLLITSANLFLKTLEEPTSRTLFILVSSRPEILLPTIISRCQNVRFAGIPFTSIFNVLKNEFLLSNEETEFYALISEGSIGRGKSLVSGDLKKISENYLTSIQDFLHSTDLESSSGIESLFTFSEKLTQEKDSFPLILELIRSWYRDLIAWKGTGDSNFVLFKDYLNEIKRTSETLSTTELYRRLDIVENVFTSIEFNTNRQLTIDDFLLNTLK